MGSRVKPRKGRRKLILLDTHVLLWLRIGDARLGPLARREIDHAWHLGELAVSSISFWEIAMLKSKNRIDFPESLELWRRVQLEQGMVEIPVDGKIGLRAVGLRDFHPDPADRLIVATALDGHRLITADARILDWPGKLDRQTAFE